VTSLHTPPTTRPDRLLIAPLPYSASPRDALPVLQRALSRHASDIDVKLRVFDTRHVSAVAHPPAE
jgi:hypothetical protein